VRFTRTMTGAALIAALTCAACGGGAARATDTASTSTSGPIKFFVTTFSNGTGNIIVTGAIGDYGTTAASGNYLKVTLHHGAFELNVAKLIAAESGSAPALDPATCSGVSSVTAPAPVLDGKGTYRGIAGTLNVTETIANYRIGQDQVLEIQAGMGCRARDLSTASQLLQAGGA